jgi:histidine ammonia-lyase
VLRQVIGAPAGANQGLVGFNLVRIVSVALMAGLNSEHHPFSFLQITVSRSQEHMITPAPTDELT